MANDWHHRRRDRGSVWRRVMLGGALLALAGGVARAQDLGNGLGSEDLYYGELPNVLSATRLSQPITDAPVAVTVIDREMIKASGAREIADIFRLVPGFLVASYDGHQRTVGYHGLLDAFNRRMQVLIDGRSVYTPTFGGVRWSDLALSIDDIEKIEVVRDPNAATYGPNAFMGVINIITRHASEEHGTYVRMATGSPGYHDEVLRTGSGKGDFDYSFTFENSGDAGFDGVHDAKQTNLITWRGDYQANARDNFEFHAGINEGPRGVGNGKVGDPYRNLQAKSYFVQAHWRRSLGLSDGISLQFYYNDFRSADSFFVTENTTLGGIPAVVSGDINFDREGRRTDIEFQHNLAPSRALQLVWGAELRRDEVVAPAIFSSQSAVENNVVRLFGETEWQLTNRLLLNAGAMVEKNDVTSTAFTPRVALNYRISPRQTARLSVSQATRTPSLFEADADFRQVINTNLPSPLNQVLLQDTLVKDKLDPEQITSWELGYVFSDPISQLSGDVKLYYDRIDKLITQYFYPLPTRDGIPVLGGETRSFRNTDSATLRGLELQLDFHPTARDRIVTGYSLVSATSTDIGSDFSDTVPRNMFNLLWIRHYARGLTTSMTYNYTDPVTYIDGSAIGPVRRLDFRVAQRLELGTKRAELALVFQNILGSYYDFRTDNVFGTRAYVSLSMDL